jgi:hypothetical protein
MLNIDVFVGSFALLAYITQIASHSIVYIAI